VLLLQHPLTLQYEPMDDFMRTLERVHYGSTAALETLADLLPQVRLVVPVTKHPARGETVEVLSLRTADGRELLAVFNNERAFRRWGLGTEWGTMPAKAVFEAALAGPFDALVVDPSGPHRMEIDRTILLLVLGITRSNPEA
jgi:hypothetical protein